MVEERFNPDMLVLARRSREWTQGELAQRAGTTQGRISKIEHGLLEPPSALVETFAKILNYPRSFFFQRAFMQGLPYWFHRKRKKLSQRTLDRIHAEVALRIIHVQQLLQSATVGEPSLPQMDLDEFAGSVEDIARAIRQRWQLPSGPIPDLTAVVENAGVLVVPCDFGLSEVDAIGVRLQGLPPLMFINNAAPVDRMRFTMAHELGHLIMHGLPTAEMETEADCFAAEFLMPEIDIRPQLHRLDIPALGVLKKLWRVSMQALLNRARQLKTISSLAYVALLKKIAALGFRRREPPEFDISPERPRLLEEVFRYHLTTLKFQRDQLMEVLRVSADDYARLYSFGGPQLRLVAG
jgi:Zn-dependent peptidase ImmA (M78 family)/DNA-binding XRE family transcriptional regulator